MSNGEGGRKKAKEEKGKSSQAPPRRDSAIVTVLLFTASRISGRQGYGPCLEYPLGLTAKAGDHYYSERKEKGPIMDIQEQKEFQEWLKTLERASQNQAQVLLKDGFPLEEIRYYVEF